MKTLVFLSVLIAIWITLFTCFVTVISPKERTVTAIGETHYRIHLFAVAHERLPEKLTDLPERPGYSNWLDDAWGQPLIYKVDDQGIITLGSLGRDGIIGGEGEDGDIIRRFRSREKKTGEFIAGNEMWVVDAEILEAHDD